MNMGVTKRYLEGVNALEYTACLFEEYLPRDVALTQAVLFKTLAEDIERAASDAPDRAGIITVLGIAFNSGLDLHETRMIVFYE